MPYAAIALLLLTECLKGAFKNDKRAVYWTSELESAFAEAKQLLKDATPLLYPENTVQLTLYTDASDKAMSAVLQQCRQELSSAQCNYSTYDCELLDVYNTVRYFIEGRTVELVMGQCDSASSL